MYLEGMSMSVNTKDKSVSFEFEKNSKILMYMFIKSSFNIAQYLMYYA